MKKKPDAAPAPKNPIGAKLAAQRRKKKLSLEVLAEKTGLKVRDLEAIESGVVFPPVGDILKISRALTVDPGQLLGSPAKDPDERKKRRIDDFNKRASSYLYTILTPQAMNKHLRAFRVVIPPGAEHPKISYQHEGEEFIYVLEGTLEITVGRKKHALKQHDALHFDSGITHALKNPGAKECVLVVTVYTP
ncbi:MAG TPA: XRE family transcriptional regulator [Spirochaetota bacterium]|nr:XRE family transcriptional regulator [Spirochaetota bacterium]HPI23785.1 XRE family transcriptional regulator [Spirochaetota bacterium]HPU90219.1 XRE family transcriptional regulator [Spirochaetota bacterium]